MPRARWTLRPGHSQVPQKNMLKQGVTEKCVRVYGAGGGGRRRHINLLVTSVRRLCTFGKVEKKGRKRRKGKGPAFSITGFQPAEVSEMRRDGLQGVFSRTLDVHVLEEGMQQRQCPEWIYINTSPLLSQVTKTRTLLLLGWKKHKKAFFSLCQWMLMLLSAAAATSSISFPSTTFCISFAQGTIWRAPSPWQSLAWADCQVIGVWKLVTTCFSKPHSSTWD